jgi:hypothetical protein
MMNFNSIVHIAGRHPALARHPDFQNWLNKHGAGIWHESPESDEGTRFVLVQSSDHLYLFAALLKPTGEGEGRGRTEEVIRSVEFDLLAEGFPAAYAILALGAETGYSSQNIQSIRPAVDLLRDPMRVRWEIEVINERRVELFVVESPSEIKRSGEREYKPLSPLRARPPRFPTAEWLGENDCHHPSRWRSLARQWAGDTESVPGQAYHIWHNVARKMTYDGSIRNVGTFTWSDNWIIERLGWRGICNEWAVLQVTLLRALDIPAAIKYLSFLYEGMEVGHACVEWSDNGTWRHMDALWGAFDNRVIYRLNGASNVTVMDADFFRDERFPSLWGMPEKNGNGQFHPYIDFIIRPAYPGNQRPGYTF